MKKAQRQEDRMQRGAGILLSITSLPSLHGIGTIGREAYDFVDLLAEMKQSYWQVLPLGPTGYGDSPYQSFSAFAGNPYLIDLDELVRQGLLTEEEAGSADGETGSLKISEAEAGTLEKPVDYGHLYQTRFQILRKAFVRFHTEKKEYRSFCDENREWLDDYVLYMVIKNRENGKPWYEWEEPLKQRKEKALQKIRKEEQENCEFYCFLQYEFFSAWTDLKAYANGKGIRIIGDIPLYAALDSADVWAEREEFLLDQEGRPTVVAGCPPDAFSDDGQKWGNPIYDWERMEKEGFSWWRRRMDAAGRLFDIIRLDHFIGFARYYSIPAENESGRNGKWNKGPGRKLTEAIEETLGKNRVIAEDLGVLVPAVKKLLKKTGWPGMRVLLFAFDGNPHNEHLPYNYESQNEVVYTGTHDNETVAGYFAQKTQKELEFAYRYLEIHERRQIPDALIREAYRSSADIVIISLQDLLGLSNEARMNFPSTIGKNWRFRMKKGGITRERQEFIRNLTEIYGREADR